MFKNRKLIAALITLVLILATLAGCGGNQAAPAPAPEAPPAQEATPAPPAEEADPEDETIRIGYVCNFMDHEWYQNVTAGALRRAEELGVILEVADSSLDSALQITLAENMIAQGVDVLALTPVDAPTLTTIVADALAQGIKVITESNPVTGALTNVGADNFASGRLAGVWMGEYALENDIELRLLIVGFPNLEDCRLRVEGFLDGLASTGADYVVRAEIDSQGTLELALSLGTDALTANQDVNAIFGINDDSTMGAVQAYINIGLDTDELIAVTFGLEGVVGREALLGDSPIIAGVAMFPDFVGAAIVDAAIAVMQGGAVPAQWQTPTIVLTAETYRDFYTQNGDVWEMNFAAIDALMR